MSTCGVEPRHRLDDPCSLPAGHDGHHSWDQRRVSWTRARILERITSWALSHDGFAPTYEDWHPGGTALHPDWRKGEWPSSFVCAKRFGKWSKAVAMADVPTRPKRVPHVELEQRECPWCGATFEVVPSSSLRYCEAEHGRLAAVARYDFEGRANAAIALRLEGHSNIEIARRWGVSRHAVAMVFAAARRRGMDVPIAPHYLASPIRRAA